jgi:hypothetical protein
MRTSTLLIALALPASLEAQGPRHAFDPPATETGAPINPDANTVPRRSDLTLVFSGTLGGIGGLLAGGVIGSRLEMARGCSGYWCGFSGGVAGAAIGSTALIPAAVHLANGRRGNFAAGLAASAAALGGGIAISLITNDAHPMLLVPVAQIIGAVIVEKRTGAARQAAERTTSPYFPTLP